MTKEQACTLEYIERNPDHVKTGCGSFYFVDEQNDPFTHCPYCGKEIAGDDDE